MRHHAERSPTQRDRRRVEYWDDEALSQGRFTSLWDELQALDRLTKRRKSKKAGKPEDAPAPLDMSPHLP